MSRKGLIEKLRSRDFRISFVAAQVRRFISAQIRTLRQANRWDQSELGQRAGGMKANAISRLESPDYGNLTINTLLRLAEAFDVGLIVRFVPISELVDWNQRVSVSSYTPAKYTEDVDLQDRKTTNDPNEFYRPAPLIPPKVIQGGNQIEWGAPGAMQIIMTRPQETIGQPYVIN